MKRSIAVAMALALSVGAAQAAFAQPDRHDDHRGGQQQHHDWRKGGRIERSDWNRGQHIDYRQHHLRRPGRGQEWREVDGNYVLAAIAGGAIAGIIASH